MKMEKKRLDKFISNQLTVSRSTVRTGIQRGQALVNGNIITDAGFIIDADSDTVVYNNIIVEYKEFLYILMNKPSGILSASNDKSRKTVVDLVVEKFNRKGLFPVGRLDKDTTGLLIITDDGVFAHNCISPKKGIPKTYIAELDGDFDSKTVERFKNGVVLADGTVCKPALLERVSKNVARLTITEGRYHQIKRMFGTENLGVNKLHRESIGGLKLPEDLKEGEYVETNRAELEKLILFRDK